MSNVFRIKDVWFFSFRYDTNHSRLPTETKTLISGLTQLMQQGMYFSYRYDLTTPLQKAAKRDPAGHTLFELSDKQYLWNYALCKEFLGRSISTKWLTPVIQGFVGIIEDEVKGRKLKLILISRRRYKRAGTRFNARGIDDGGNVANMVETEQITLYNNIASSLVQVRGSVPIFWGQTGVSAVVNLSRTPEMSFPAFSKHFDSLVKRYNRILILNLLSRSKEGEAKLIRAYEANTSVYEKKPNASVRYCYFDFHQERYNSVEQLLRNR